MNTGLAITWGIDNHLKTPYTIAADFSVQRELSHGFSVEADYVGTFGRHLLQQLDLAEPLDLVDPKSGMDYFAAGTLLAKATYAGQTTVPAIPYWEDMFPYLASPGMSATQNIYTNVYQQQALSGNDSFALAVLDAFCLPSEGGLGCGPNVDANGNVQTRFYQRQFSSLYAWSSIGMSSYNALQLILRRVTNVGLALNFSYTYGNSIDMGSDTERASEFTTNSFSFITNSFNPSLNRGVSDFDTRSTRRRLCRSTPLWPRQAICYQCQPPDGLVHRRLDAVWYHALVEWVAVQRSSALCLFDQLPEPKFRCGHGTYQDTPAHQCARIARGLRGSRFSQQWHRQRFPDALCISWRKRSAQQFPR